MSDQQPPPEHTQRYLPGSYQPEGEATDTVSIRKRLNTPPAVPPQPGFAPAPLLEHLVTAGYLGRKSGRGFRDHTRR